jgi:hypothetical protein
MSDEEAANWAHRVLSAKNTLTTADAERVEQAFQARLASIVTGAADALSPESRLPRKDRGKKRPRAAAIDKSVLSLPAPRRIRDRDHVRLVAKQPCLICGRRPADAHHLRFAQSKTLGRKVSDEFTVPLCRGHHREIHRCGNEVAWWKKLGVDPTVSGVPCGWKAIHYPRRAVANKAGQNPTGESNRVRTAKRSHFLMRAPNDLRQTVRGQPSQLSQEHRS